MIPSHRDPDGADAPPPLPATSPATGADVPAATGPTNPILEAMPPAEAGSEPPAAPLVMPATGAVPAAAEASEVPAVLPLAGPAAAGPERKRNYIAAHWAGEHSIGRSYWVNVFLASLGLGLIGAGLGNFDGWDLVTVSLLGLALLAFSLPLALWQWVGLLRSILRRRRDPAQRASVGWGWLGLGLLSLGLVVIVPSQRIPMMLGFVDILTGDRRMPPVQVPGLPGGKAVEIAGGLPAGSAAKVLAVLEATPGAQVVHIESSGGRIREALEIARFVRQRRLNTYVSRQCQSAATLIFAAGAERHLARGARLGFHAGAFPGVNARALRWQNPEPIEFMRAAGIAPAFLERAFSTPNTTMWFPTVEELTAARVITAVAKPGEFGMSGAQIDEMTPERVDKVFLKVPVYQAFREYDPEGYADMVKAAVDAAAKGESMERAISASRAALLVSYNKALPRASDDALARLVVFWEMLVRKYGKTHPAVVRAVFDAKPVTGRIVDLLPEYPVNAEFDLMAKVFNTASGEPPKIDEAAARTDILLVVNRMEEITGGAREKFIHSGDLGDGEYVEIFGLYARCLTEVLPPDRRANFVRFAFNEL